MAVHGLVNNHDFHRIHCYWGLGFQLFLQSAKFIIIAQITKSSRARVQLQPIFGLFLKINNCFYMFGSFSTVGILLQRCVSTIPPARDGNQIQPFIYLLTQDLVRHEFHIFVPLTASHQIIKRKKRHNVTFGNFNSDC